MGFLPPPEEGPQTCEEQEFAPHLHLLVEKPEVEVVEERVQQKEVEQWLWAPEQTEEGGSETSQEEEGHKR